MNQTLDLIIEKGSGVAWRRVGQALELWERRSWAWKNNPGAASAATSTELEALAEI